MTTTIISIDNLKCAGCAHTIQNSLEKIRGVGSVQVDLDNECVTFEHETDEAVQQVRGRLAFLGYPLAGTSNTFQKAKSYVSCAVGKLSQ